MSKSDSIAPGFAHKPAKPNPDFPLFPHATKRWAKKIRGKMHYFGPWDDPDAALAKYLAEKDALHSGRKPREVSAGVTVKVLANAFLNFKRARLDTGELSPRTWTSYVQTAELIVGQFGKGRLVEDLRPDDFAALRNAMTRRWGLVRVKNFITQVRSVFKYGYESELLAIPVRYGPDFAPPSNKRLRQERAKKGPRMFEAAEVRKLVNGARVAKRGGEVDVGPTTSLKAMILLGINCGFGNEDCGTLPRSALDLKGGWVDYPRPKTGNERRCPLWPETAAALRAVLAERREPLDAADADLVFLTATGRRWAKDTNDAPVSKETRKLLDALGIEGNKNFYALRHTFRTIADETRDQPAADLIMGHNPTHISSAYRERIGDDRLKAVSDHVRKWVFADDQKAKAKKPRGQKS